MNNDIAGNGYGIFPGIVEREHLTRFMAGLSGEDMRRSRAGIRHLMHSRHVQAIASGQAMMEIAKSIVGPGAVPFRATLFDKSPDSNWLVMWHQDTALPLEEKRELEGWGPWSVKDGFTYAHAPAEALEQVIALRLHVDDSKSDNGPLRVLPGTHNRGLLDDSQMHDLAASIPSVDCTVLAGGVIAMRPLVVHASSKSTSDAPRRVLHIEYAAQREILAGMRLAIA